MDDSRHLPLAGMLAAALAAALLTGAVAAQQHTYGVFGLGGLDAGARQFGTLDAGQVALLGSPGSLASGTLRTASGLTAYDRATRRVHLLARTDADQTDRVLTIDTATGATVAAPALSLGTIAQFSGIEFDDVAGRLLGVLDVAGGDEQLVAIDPVLGTVTPIGAPLAGTALTTNPGLLACSRLTGRVFLPGREDGGPDTLYTIDADTGALLTAPLTGVAMNRITGLEYDDATATLLALVAIGAARQLAAIDPDTGAATLLGPGPIAGGVAIATIQGATTFDDGGHGFRFVGRSAGAWQHFVVDAATGLATSQTIAENGMRSGLYVGLEFAEPLTAAAFGSGCPAGSPLTLTSNEPRLGTTWTTYGSAIEPVSPIALFWFGALAIDPGIDLGFLGAPGCLAHTEAGYGAFVAPTANGQSSYSIPLPRSANLFGLELVVQMSAASTATAAGFATSNGVRAVPGF